MENERVKNSGGCVADNFRQGYRAECLAQYIMSEFGPCERIRNENDYGVDLICTLMEKDGVLGVVSELYGLQVKSGEAIFKYSGKYLLDWIKAYNYPLFMCRVDSENKMIFLYSTWTLHDLLLRDKEFDKINSILFKEEFDENGKIKMPQLDELQAVVWMGKPIIQISVNELKYKERIEECRNVLREWVECEVMNYSRRKMGISIGWGYTSWETNRSLNTSVKHWYKPYYFNDDTSKRAMEIIQECAALIAKNKGSESGVVTMLRELLIKHGVGVDDFQKEALGIK